jgi:hypothetical protein
LEFHDLEFHDSEAPTAEALEVAVMHKRRQAEMIP